MQLSELKAGDVLLFEPLPDSHLSWAVAYLSGSPVSHAGLFGDSAAQSVIEELAPHVRELALRERLQGRNVRVCRLANAELALEPVVAAARAYINRDEPYAERSLFLVAMLLLNLQRVPSPEAQRVMIRILKSTAASMMEYGNRQNYPRKLPLVSSQFVAQSFADAGSEYRLQLEAGQDRSQSLLARIIAKADSVRPKERPMLPMFPPVGESAEELCQELQEALEQPLGSEAPIFQELIDTVYEFGKAYRKLRGSSMMPDAGQLQADFRDTLKFLQRELDQLVTPGDLLTQCANLEEVGTLEG